MLKLDVSHESLGQLCLDGLSHLARQAHHRKRGVCHRLVKRTLLLLLDFSLIFITSRQGVVGVVSAFDDQAPHRFVLDAFFVEDSQLLIQFVLKSLLDGC